MILLLVLRVVVGIDIELDAFISKEGVLNGRCDGFGPDGLQSIQLLLNPRLVLLLLNG